MRKSLTGRILFIDDDKAGREVALFNLRRAGCVVTPAAEGFGWPYRILFSPDTRTVMLPDLRREELRFLDRASKRELARLTFPGGGPQGVTTTEDGRYLFQSLSREGRIAIVETALRRVVGYLAAGETPDGVAYTSRVISPRTPPAP